MDLLILIFRIAITIMVAIVASIAGFYAAAILLAAAINATPTDWFHFGALLAVITILILPGLIGALFDRYYD